MERVVCPLCGADSPRIAYQVKDWQQGVDGAFTIVRCGECALLYLSPRPTLTELATYYPADYAAYQRGPLGTERWWVRRPRMYGLDKRCRAVTRFASQGRLLDVGCATGDFLARMRRYGRWELVGLERDPRAAASARQQYGLEVYEGPMDQVDLASQSFDVVTLWDVVEHLPQPGASLRRITEWLQPGGRLVMRTPDASSVYARVFGRYWAGLDAPRHLTVLDRASLLRLLSQNGFQVERLWVLSGSYAITALSLRFWLRASGRSPRWSKLVENPAAQLLTAPLFWLIDRFGGAALTVVARRTS